MNKKYLPIVIAAIVLVLGVGSLIVFSNKSTNKNQMKTNELPTSEIVPTVDSTVMVTLEAIDQGKHQLKLTVAHMPSGTKSLEYELTYDTKDQGSQGISPGAVDIKSTDKPFTRDFLLGTESSGARTYHVVTSPIKLTVIFQGSYGKKSFEKDYELAKM